MSPLTRKFPIPSLLAVTILDGSALARKIDRMIDTYKENCIYTSKVLENILWLSPKICMDTTFLTESIKRQDEMYPPNPDPYIDGSNTARPSDCSIGYPLFFEKWKGNVFDTAQRRNDTLQDIYDSLCMNLPQYQAGKLPKGASISLNNLVSSFNYLSLLHYHVAVGDDNSVPQPVLLPLPGGSLPQTESYLQQFTALLHSLREWYNKTEEGSAVWTRSVHSYSPRQLCALDTSSLKHTLAVFAQWHAPRPYSIRPALLSRYNPEVKHSLLETDDCALRTAILELVCAEARRTPKMDANRYADCFSLENDLRAFVASSAPAPEVAVARQELLMHMQEELLQYSQGRFTVTALGSVAMGVDGQQSDLDVAITRADTETVDACVGDMGVCAHGDYLRQLRAAAPSDDSADAVWRECKAMLGKVNLWQTGAEVSELHLNRRIPLVKLRHLDMFDVDMSIARPSSVANVRLVCAWAAACPFFVPLVRAVKAWGDARAIIDGAAHWLNSWTLLLMVAQFLQLQGLLPTPQPSSPLSPLHARFRAQVPVMLQARMQATAPVPTLSDFPTFGDKATRASPVKPAVDASSAFGSRAPTRMTSPPPSTLSAALGAESPSLGDVQWGYMTKKQRNAIRQLTQPAHSGLGGGDWGSPGLAPMHTQAHTSRSSHTRTLATTEPAAPLPTLAELLPTPVTHMVPIQSLQDDSVLLSTPGVPALLFDDPRTAPHARQALLADHGAHTPPSAVASPALQDAIAAYTHGQPYRLNSGLKKHARSYIDRMDSALGDWEANNASHVISESLCSPAQWSELQTADAGRLYVDEARSLTIGLSEPLAFTGLPDELRYAVGEVAPPAIPPQVTLASLFVGFFTFYGFEFSPALMGVSTRRGHLIWAEQMRRPQAEGGLLTEHQAFLCVEEPFNPQRNTARNLTPARMHAVFTEMRRAAVLLREGRSLSEVMQPLDRDHERLKTLAKEGPQGFGNDLLAFACVVAPLLDVDERQRMLNEADAAAAPVSSPAAMVMCAHVRQQLAMLVAATGRAREALRGALVTQQCALATELVELLPYVQSATQQAQHPELYSRSVQAAMEQHYCGWLARASSTLSDPCASVSPQLAQLVVAIERMIQDMGLRTSLSPAIAPYIDMNLTVATHSPGAVAATPADAAETANGEKVIPAWLQQERLRVERVAPLLVLLGLDVTLEDDCS